MSKIEWTDTTWNPITGCTKVSEGCRNCYAETIANRFWGDRKFTDVICHEDRLQKPFTWRKPRMVFVNSMSDLFHEDVPGEFIVKILNTIEKNPQHIFQVLTKRPERMRDFFWGESGAGSDVPPIPNLWLGVSIEDQKSADDRIGYLEDTPAAIRFLSCEPLLGPVDLSYYLDLVYHELSDAWVKNQVFIIGDGIVDGPPVRGTVINWIILGGESGPKARPMEIEWAKTIKDQSYAASVAFFFKQGSQANWESFKDFDSFPKDLQIREFPSVKKAELF